MMMRKITIGELLSMWRRWKQDITGEKWTQKRVAQEAGLLPTYISQILNKEPYRLRPATVKKLAGVFETTPGDFIKGTPDFMTKDLLNRAGLVKHTLWGEKLKNEIVEIIKEYKRINQGKRNDYDARVISSYLPEHLAGYVMNEIGVNPLPEKLTPEIPKKTVIRYKNGKFKTEEVESKRRKIYHLLPQIDDPEKLEVIYKIASTYADIDMGRIYEEESTE